MAQEQRRLTLWQGKVETEVEVNGDGPPLLYLHGPWGLERDRDFIACFRRSLTSESIHPRLK